MAARQKAQHGDGDTERVGVAFDAGVYLNFTGLIQWGKNEGYVQNADFELTTDPVGFQELLDTGVLHNIIWKNGIWIGGTWDYGIWEGGRWKGGKWKDGWWRMGSFDGGLWLDGHWLDGDWNTDGAEWMNGNWHRGRCIDAITGRWTATNEDPYRFKLRRNKER